MKNFITIHASNTGAKDNLKLADLDLQDRQHGFSRVGYHYVIRRDGLIEDGRQESEASLHDHISTARQSLSICLVGGAGEDGKPFNNFTEVQWIALTQKVWQLCEDHPEAVIKVVTKSVPQEFVIGMYTKLLSQGKYN